MQRALSHPYRLETGGPPGVGKPWVTEPLEQGARIVLARLLKAIAAKIENGNGVE